MNPELFSNFRQFSHPVFYDPIIASCSYQFPCEEVGC
uniref:Uncharacterized protein n=1 Tax=Anguilla anguilla TaxID=7936 RepID=A0A0E9PHR0_ANGAN